jgi:hypothetical protein
MIAESNKIFGLWSAVRQLEEGALHIGDEFSLSRHRGGIAGRTTANFVASPVPILAFVTSAPKRFWTT